MSRPMPLPKTVNYSKPATPANYKCARCGATNCKLWREYQTINPQLLCARCTGKNQKIDISGIDSRGRIADKDFTGRRTDQIGWYVPAVPDEEGVGYWGYTSVPQAGCDWWAKLPTLPVNNRA